MRFIKNYIWFFALLLSYSFLPAKESTLNDDITAGIKNGTSSFVENMGQIVIMENHTPVSSILFRSSSNSSDIYLQTNGISYVFYKINTPETDENDIYASSKTTFNGEWERIDMEFVNCNSKPIIEKSEQTDYYENYYLAQCQSGIKKVKSYRKITYKNIYKNIDWVVHYNENGQLKYDFIVHPGGNPNDIQIKYNWSDAPVLNQDGSIQINGPLGNILEAKPFVTQENQEIISSWEIQNKGILTFKINSFDKNKELIIDPILFWATYYGGNSDEKGYSIKSDGTSVFVSGIVASVNFPTLNPGGTYFQGTFSGVGDGFIIKFDSNGVRQWATYYGGSNNDFIWASSINSNSIYLTGQTISDDFPTFDPGTGAYYQNTNAVSGASDAFILMFDKSGIRQWATYFGGNVDEAGYSIFSTDSYIEIAIRTGSSNLPMYNPGGGATQNSFLGGANDYYVLKLTAQGIPFWSTYFGGSNEEEGFPAICEFNGSIYLAGATNSTDYPTLNPGGTAYFQGVQSGAKDITLTKFTTGGILTWSTYLGGSLDETVRSIATNNNQIWIGGFTSSTNIPTMDMGNGAYYQNTNGGGLDGFIASFNTNNEYVWGTYYGGISTDYFTSLHADSKNIWATGKSGSTNFPLLNPGMGSFFQSVKGAGNDGFILKFKQTGIRQWATYYGGNGNEETYSIFSDNTYVWVTGLSNSTNLTTQDPGNSAYYSSTNTGSNDAFILKFDVCIKPNVTITSSSPVICLLDTTVLIANGAQTYEWQTPNIFNDSLIISPPITSNFIVTGTDDMNCLNNDTFTVQINPLPQLIITQPDSICFGDSITLHVTSDLPSYYLWAPGLTNDSILIAYPDTVNHTFNYFVLVTDTLNGCKNATSTSIYVNALPQLAISQPDSICLGDTITLTVSSNLPSYYLWTPGNGTDSIFAVSPDTVHQTFLYSVLVTDTVNGCKSNASTSVFVNALPQLTITQPDSICKGDTITLHVSSNLPSTYLWTPGNGTDSLFAVSPNNANLTYLYNVLVTDTINGCKSNAITSVFVNAIPQLFITPPDSICYGDNLTLQVFSDLFSAFLWSPGNGTDSTLSAYTVHPNIPYQHFIYNVVATDTLNGCKNYASTNIFTNGKPDISIFGSHPICSYDSVFLTAHSNDTISVSHLWLPGLDTSSTFTFYPNLPDSIYQITVIGTSKYNCKDTATTFIIVYPSISVNITPTDTSICLLDSITLHGNASLIGNTGYSFEWSGHNVTATSSDITFYPDSTGTYILIGTTTEQCKDTASVNISIFSLPKIIISGFQEMCFGDSVIISASTDPPDSTTIFNWAPYSGSNTSTVTLFPATTTSYVVTGIDTNTCHSSIPFDITVYQLPVASISGINQICYGDQTILTASNSTTPGITHFLWNTNDTTNTITVSPPNTSVFSVIAFQNICSDTANYQVTIDPKPVLTLIPDSITLVIGMSVQLNVSGANDYLWSPVDGLSCVNCPNPVVTPYNTIEYCVVGSNNFGCSDTACVNITIDKECGEVFVPSAFSPNGDGQNDILYVYGKCIKSMEFRIFNRWGEKVFESTDPDIGWDGRFRGKESDTDVFVYYLKAEYYIGQKVETKGNITLMR